MSAGDPAVRSAMECSLHPGESTPASARCPPAAGSAARLGIETITSLPALLALRDDWTRLFARAGEGLPFATHEWAVAWWTHLRRDDHLLRDSLRVRVLRDAGGAAVAIAPFMLSERPARGPVRARALQFLGTDPNVTELRRPLVEPADETGVVLRLVEHLQQRDESWDWAVLSGLERSTGALEAWLEDGRGAWSGETHAYVLALPDAWDELRARLRRNIRESLRKCYNSLARARHDFRLSVAESPREVAEALELFFDLHRRRAALATTVAHADCFATPAARAFLRDVCQRLAERRATRVFVLRVGAAPVAARVAFQFGERLYLYYSGYDPAWAHYSVMTTTLAEALKWSIATGIRSVNLSTGRDVSKTRWGPEEITYREATLVRPGLRSRLAYHAYRWGFEARHRSRLRHADGHSRPTRA